jgi:hypothetical protein
VQIKVRSRLRRLRYDQRRLTGGATLVAWFGCKQAGAEVATTFWTTLAGHRWGGEAAQQLAQPDDYV